MVKVSVIITTYNAAKSIVKTLNSVLAQHGAESEFSLEIIVVDDCSTDSTVQLLSNFRIHYFSTPCNSGGPNKGRNMGLKHATGDFICFLDHDDVWEPQKIQLQLIAAAKAPIVSCGYEVSNSFTGIHTIVGVPQATVWHFERNETFVRKLSKAKERVQHTYLSTMMIHKDLRHVLFEEHYGMLDFDWLLRLFEDQHSVEVPLPLVSRFVDGKNLSLNPNYRSKDYHYALQFIRRYELRYPREVARAHQRINGSRARYCYLMGEMREARKYLLQAEPGMKACLYYFTSFFGSDWVKRNFTVFG